MAESIEGPLADIGIRLTEDRAGHTVAHYSGRKGDFDRTVTVVRDKWWSKNRGRFTIFLAVEPANRNSNRVDGVDSDAAEMPLADLMGRGTSDWKIWATDDKPPFIDELKSGMQEHGIPWLERVSDPEGFAQWREEEGY